MKHINFINTLSPLEQKKIARWYRITILSIAALISSMIIIHGWQLRRIIHVRSFYNSLLHNTAKYEKTSHEYMQTLKQYEQLKDYCKECTYIHDQLEYCITSLLLARKILAMPGITLSSWKFIPQSFIANIQSSTVAEAINCVHALKDLPTAPTITIKSLQAHVINSKTQINLQFQGIISDKKIEF